MPLAGVPTAGTSDAPLSSAVKGQTVLVVRPWARKSAVADSLATNGFRLVVVNKLTQFESSRLTFFCSRKGGVPPTQFKPTANPLSTELAKRGGIAEMLPNKPWDCPEMPAAK